MRIAGKRFGRLRVAVSLLVAGFGAAAQEPPPPPPVVVSMDKFFDPNNPESSSTQQIIDFMKANPDVEVRQWGGIELPAGRASLMMALAGNTAPDIGEAWFHIIRNEIKQNFLYPLNEWIGEDLDGDGQISDAEAKWPGWKKVRPLWRQVATVDGKVYGLPNPARHMTAIIFRTDLVQAAGLDPANPPKTWDEFLYWCRKLTDPNREVPGAILQNGQRGVALPPNGYFFLPWIESAGGQPIVQVRRSPTDGKEYTFAQDATSFITPSGENLARVVPEWRANFAGPEGMAALDFFYELRWGKFLVDPDDGEPVGLTASDLERGFVMRGEKKISFTPDQVISGVARSGSNQPGMSDYSLLSNGEVAMMVTYVQSLDQMGASLNLDPGLLSWFPYPAGPGPKGIRIVQMMQHYVVMYANVGERSKSDRDAVWRAMQAVVDEKSRDYEISGKVLAGMARFVAPEDLRRLGYEEYIRDIPQALQRIFAGLDDGSIGSRTEPWSGFWYLMDKAYARQVLSILLSSSGEHFDYRQAVIDLERNANSGLMFEVPKSTLDAYRPYARIALAIVVAVMGVFLYKIVRSYTGKRKEGARSVYAGWIPLALLLPALAIIALWKYYPLLRGMVMAFQDYRIVGKSEFVGLDNFIILATDKSFWMSMLRTCYFVFLNMTLAFLAPIGLAILLTEVPRGKIFFRTLFFLPQMTSGIVIALMWKLMYNPTPAGFFNQLIGYLNKLPFVNISTQTWLEDPKLAMICCVVPSVWASMGMASLIYLAALHSIPPELYEAAEVDGAGMRTKLWKITIPYLLPLIIINFVGAFIATFQNMGNIFLMTFGGPGEATTVAGLKIWIEAYNNLRFSMATSMACVIGALLIGLTYIQIQFLKRVEYKRAAD